MTIAEIISGLKFTIEMFLVDPNTGEKLTEPRNNMDKITLDACKGAIKALEQQPCEDCISRAEVLKILEKEEFKGDAIYEIEKKLPSVTPKAERWIPCTERLPEKDGCYLVTYKWKGSYSGDTYVETTMAVYREKPKEWDCKDVIAWMPLPEPYKAESEDKE